MEESVLDKVIRIVNEKFEGSILQTQQDYDFPVLVLKSEVIVPIILHLKEHEQTKFQYLTTLCGIHYPELHQIAVMYQLHNMVSNEKVRLKVMLPQDNPVVQTLTTVFAGANWMERETFDFFGVKFTGHPDLRRILNVEEMIIHPLRKEYPLEDQVRTDKDDARFGR